MNIPKLLIDAFIEDMSEYNGVDLLYDEAKVQLSDELSEIINKIINLKTPEAMSREYWEYFECSEGMTTRYSEQKPKFVLQKIFEYLGRTGQ